MRQSLLALIMLTQLDGGTVWVESTQVIILRGRAHGCEAKAGAALRVGSTSLCVLESVDLVRNKIRDAK